MRKYCKHVFSLYIPCFEGEDLYLQPGAWAETSEDQREETVQYSKLFAGPWDCCAACRWWMTWINTSCQTMIPTRNSAYQRKLFSNCYSWGLSPVCQAHPSGTPCSTAGRGTKRTERLRCQPTTSCEMQWRKDKTVLTCLNIPYRDIYQFSVIQCTQQDVHIAFSSQFSCYILLQMLLCQVRVSGESGYMRPVPNGSKLQQRFSVHVKAMEHFYGLSQLMSIDSKREGNIAWSKRGIIRYMPLPCARRCIWLTYLRRLAFMSIRRSFSISKIKPMSAQLK